MKHITSREQLFLHLKESSVWFHSRSRSFSRAVFPDFWWQEWLCDNSQYCQLAVRPRSGWRYRDSTSHKSNLFSVHSALGPISKFSAGNHQEILQISQAGIHFLFPQKEFFNRSIIRSKFCKSKERISLF